MALDIFIELGNRHKGVDVVETMAVEAKAFGITHLKSQSGYLYYASPYDGRMSFYYANSPGDLPDIDAPYGIGFDLSAEEKGVDVWLGCSVSSSQGGVAETVWISQQGSASYKPSPEDPDYPLVRRVYAYVRKLHELLGAVSTEASQSVSGYVEYSIGPNGEEKGWE